MNTMAKFMRYHRVYRPDQHGPIGYSPLPAQLSQFMANAIGYMTGQAATTLTVKNCANPQFKGGDLGVGATAAPTPPPTLLRKHHLGDPRRPAEAPPAAKSGGKVTAKSAVVKTSNGKTVAAAGVTATGSKVLGTSGGSGSTTTSGSSNGSSGANSVTWLSPHRWPTWVRRSGLAPRGPSSRWWHCSS